MATPMMFQTTIDGRGAPEKITVTDQAYHRNGVGGAGFIVSLFDKEEPDGTVERMIGISFTADQVADPRMTERTFFELHTAVLDLALAADGVIGFGDNSWRGADVYGPTLADAWRKQGLEDPVYPSDPFIR